VERARGPMVGRRAVLGRAGPCPAAAIKDPLYAFTRGRAHTPNGRPRRPRRAQPPPPRAAQRGPHRALRLHPAVRLPRMVRAGPAATAAYKLARAVGPASACRGPSTDQGDQSFSLQPRRYPPQPAESPTPPAPGGLMATANAGAIGDGASRLGPPSRARLLLVCALGAAALQPGTAAAGPRRPSPPRRLSSVSTSDLACSQPRRPPQGHPPDRRPQGARDGVLQRARVRALLPLPGGCPGAAWVPFTGPTPGRNAQAMCGHMHRVCTTHATDHARPMRSPMRSPGSKAKGRAFDPRPAHLLPVPPAQRGDARRQRAACCGLGWTRPRRRRPARRPRLRRRSARRAGRCWGGTGSCATWNTGGWGAFRQLVAGLARPRFAWLAPACLRAVLMGSAHPTPRVP
jgi:hypothetical protein